MVYNIALCSAEPWTYNKNEEEPIKAFEVWCYRRIQNINWTEIRGY